MHAASRESLNKVAEHLDNTVGGENALAAYAQTGMELFEVVDVLDTERSLRVALSDPATDAEDRARVVEKLFTGKVADTTFGILTAAARLRWSNDREFRQALVVVARRSLLRGADQMGQLDKVENELFQLSRLLEREGKLTSLISDRNAESSAKRGLLSTVLYGKVTMVTEALALQAVGRPERNPIDDIAAISTQAADLRGRDVARVVSAGELSDQQRDRLAEKLREMYGREMSLHTEVDPSLLGGMVIRVGDERIDGSTSGKLERLRAQLA